MKPTDPVSQAVEKFQKALEASGLTNVIILYAYDKDGECITGGSDAPRLLTLGALEQMKYDLLTELLTD